MVKIKKAHEPIIIKAIKALIYGEPGIGKTTLSLTAPKPILFDVDKGLRRVNPKFRSDAITIEEWDDIIAALADPEVKNNYETAVVDTIGKALELLAKYIVRNNHKLGTKNGALTQQGWGVLLAEFKNFLMTVDSLGMNIIFVAHDREHTENENRVVRPDIAGRSLGNIIRDMDLVGYMQSRNNERTISFDPTDNHYGKNTCGLKSVMYIEDFNKTNAKPLEDIFHQYSEMIESQCEVSISYHDQVSTIFQKIDSIDSLKVINDIILEFKNTTDFIWDAKTIARDKLAEKSKELGFIFDKSIQRYIKEGKKAKKATKPVQKSKHNKPKDDKKPTKPQKETLTVVEENDFANFVNKAKIAYSKGNTEESKKAYESAYSIKPMPWIKGRLTKLEDGN